MKPTLFLRIAAVLTLLQCTMHTVFGVFGKPGHGAEEIAVIESMKAYRFNVMGSMRAYWDFFFGYGLSVSIALFIQGILFWQLSTIIGTNPAASRPIVALFFFNCLATAVVCWKYFFLGPTITQLLIAACLALSFATATSA